MSGSPAGKRTEPGFACSSRSRSATTPSEPWSGPCRSTPRSTGLISMPPAPAEGGGDGGRTGRSGAPGGSPGAGPVPRRADHQGSSRVRRPGPAPGRGRHARQHQRPDRLRRRPRCLGGAPGRRRAPPPQVRRGHRGQGVPVPGDPPGSAAAGHPGGDPAAGGPEGQPPAAREGRRSSTATCTRPAMSSNAASTGSSSSAPPRPASTNSPPATGPDSTLRHSSSGSVDPNKITCQTGPSGSTRLRARPHGPRPRQRSQTPHGDHAAHPGRQTRPPRTVEVTAQAFRLYRCSPSHR
ncbi:hypothetical protein SUDANB126_07011 [Streptomyces sp. enrichment culture]